MVKILKSKSKILKWVLLGFGVVILSAIGTILIIKFVIKAPTEKTPVTPPAVVKAVSTISPEDLLKKFSTEHKLDGYTPSATASNSTISYKLADSSYAVQTNSRNNVQFTKEATATQTDLQKAVKVSQVYLEGNKFQKVSERILTNSIEMIYDDINTACKLFSNLDPIKQVSLYGLACVEKKVLTTEYDSIQTLVAIYKKTGGTTDFKDVVRTTHAEGNKAVSLLAITPQDSTTTAYTLIFAAIDNKWAFVGKRITPSVDVKDSFEISSELKTAISNPKYGGIVTKYVY